MANSPEPHIAILMATRNGSRFIAEQLLSIGQQSYPNWSLHVSDDGSSDGTSEIAEKFQAEWASHQIRIYDGPQRGYAQNFLSLVCNPDIRADLYAYSDQDDIWESEKLLRAVTQLSKIPNGIPALYCSRLHLIDAAGGKTGLSPLFRKTPSFGHALVQTIAPGITMVFNNATRELLLRLGRQDVLAHDLWTYQIVTACGGRVIYDEQPTVRYRQHTSNLIGMNMGLSGRLRRVLKALGGMQKLYNEQSIRSLEPVVSLMSADARNTYERWLAIRNQGLLRRLKDFHSIGVTRRSTFQNFGLYLLLLAKRL
jgi:glycosyltransferase involved in cell wall biosynthesis